MPFIGNQPAEKYSAFTKQDFSTSATTSYTLSQSVANENEIALFINFVRQEPTTAYTASGTSLTLTSATASSDDMYCVYLGKAVQTVNPPSGSVGSSQLSGALVTPSTLDVNGNELILDADADTSITADTDDQIDFKTAGSDRMSIIADGKVGIGTTSPTRELTVGNNANARIEILSSDNSAGASQLQFGDPDNSQIGRIYYDHSDNSMRFHTNNSEFVRIDSSGNFFIGKSSTSDTVIGHQFNSGGGLTTIMDTNKHHIFNKQTEDGTIIFFKQANSTEGSISVSGSTVSYNGFTGTHWSRLTDNSKPTILKGTVLETLDEMCDWYNLEFDVTKDGQTWKEKIPHVLANGEAVGDVVTYNFEGTDYQATIVKEDDIKHMKSKVSDTTDAKNVYGVFNSWDEDGEGYNDFYVASVGSFVVRIKSGQTIAKGDLLQSNGDGTAKVQSDDNVKSSSFAKVLSTTVIETYDDGSFIVPCSLMC